MARKISLIIFLSLAMIITIPNLAYASMDDGTLSKYSSDGKYKINLSWQPTGPLQSDTDYTFKFQVSDGLTEKIISDAFFDLDLSKDGQSIGTISELSSSEDTTQGLRFNEAGLFKTKIYNLLGSDQDVNFTFPISSEESITVNGISYGEKAQGIPQMFFCKGNAITLGKCFQSESYEDYSWFGKMNVLIYAPGWNNEPNRIESIGGTVEEPLTVTSRSERSNAELGVCSGLVETGADTGLFVGRLKLSGYDYDMNGDGNLETGLGGTKCDNSPIDQYGRIETGRNGAVTVNWQYSDYPAKSISKTLTYHWNLGELSFLQDEYNIGDTLKFKLKDIDLGDMPKDKMDLNFRAYSESDRAGVIIETGENFKFKDTFEFSVNSSENVGRSLYALPGDTIYVEYNDCTLPKDYNFDGIANSKNECEHIIATTQIVGNYPSITIEP